MNFLESQLEDPVRFTRIKRWFYVGLVVLSLAEIVLPRFFGGLHPLWGNGVTSSIKRIVKPEEDNPVIALSRPDPGPLTFTSISCKPNYDAFSDTDSAAR